MDGFGRDDRKGMRMMMGTIRSVKAILFHNGTACSRGNPSDDAVVGG